MILGGIDGRSFIACAARASARLARALTRLTGSYYDFVCDIRCPTHSFPTEKVICKGG